MEHEVEELKLAEPGIRELKIEIPPESGEPELLHDNNNVFIRIPVSPMPSPHRQVEVNNNTSRHSASKHNAIQRIIESTRSSKPTLSDPTRTHSIRKRPSPEDKNEADMLLNFGYPKASPLINHMVLKRDPPDFMMPKHFEKDKYDMRPPSPVRSYSDSYVRSVIQEPPPELHRSSATLIDEHLQEIQYRINAHTAAYLRYKKRDRIIGYPVTMFSSFIASTLMVNISNDESNSKKAVDTAGLVLAVISFTLSLSKDYLGYVDKYQAHDISSKLYTNLLRSVEVRLVKEVITADERRDMFKDIVDQMSIIEQYELPIPKDIEEEIRGEIFLPRSVVINRALQADGI